MFDYTRNAFNKVIEDFKKILLTIQISTQALTIIYLIFAVSMGMGVLIANAILLALTTSYFIFFLYILNAKQKKKDLKRRITEIYKWCKRSVKLLSIGITAYGLFITNTNFNLTSLILLLLTIVGWILELLFFFICKFLEAEVQLILDGFHMDTKPLRDIGNFFKKITGKKIEEEPDTSKNKELLDELVKKEKAEKRRQKEEERIEKRSNFSLWWQDKTAVFKRKKGQPLNGDTPVEQIPAPVEEQAISEIFDEEL